MDSTSARMAKRFLPGTATFFSSAGVQSAIQFGEMAAAMMRGKGAGSGWDIAGEIRAAMKFIKPGAVVFDVGANLGEWSKAIESDLGLEVKIYLFEPQPVCCEHLRALFSEGVVLTQAAVSQTSGKMPLYTPGGTAGNASLHVRKDTYFADTAMSPIEVDVISLDEFIASKGIAQVDFLKMDIEGNELFALRGAVKALETGVIKAMSFEFGSGNINSRTYFRDLWDLLTGHRYRIFRVLPGGSLVLVGHYDEELEYFRGVTNYIASLEDS